MFARGLKTSRKLMAAIAVGATSALVATPTTLAQETTAEVRGVVIDTSGAPLEGATICYSKATGISKRLKQTQTVATGMAYLRVLFMTSKSGPMGPKSMTKGVSLAVGQSAVLNYNLSAMEEVMSPAHRL